MPRTHAPFLATLLAIVLHAPQASAQETSEDFIEAAVKLEIDFASLAEVDTLEHAGDRDGALTRLEEAIESSPRDATLLAARGIVRVRNGDNEAARQDFLDATELDANDPSGFAGLCYLSTLDGKKGLMLDHCTAARSRNIEDPVYGKIATVADFMVDPEASIAEAAATTLDGLVHAYPYVPAIRLLSLESNLRNDKLDAAAPDLQMLRQMYANPKGPPRIIDQLAAFRLADIVGTDIDCLLTTAALRIAESQGKAVSDDDLQRLAECRPEDESITERQVQNYNQAGLDARVQGDYAAAVEHLKAGLALSPGNPDLLSNLSYAAFEGGDLVTAEDALRQLREQDPDDDKIRCHYAVVLMQMGREAEGRPLLEGCGGN